MEDKPEIHIVIKVLCFILGLFLFVIGTVIGLFGLILWKWFSFPKFTFTFCSIPILLSIFFFGYCFYENNDEVVLTKQPSKKKSYYKDERNQKEKVCNAGRKDFNSKSRDSYAPLPWGRETGRFISGYYVENSGSFDDPTDRDAEES